MPWATQGGVRIHYEVEGQGPPLVLQHGLTQRIESWSLCGYVERLREAYRLVLIDARGHGESDRPHDPAAYALEERVGDVLAVLDALGLERAHYWGYSMGGWIGFGLARAAPQRVERLVIGGQHPYGRRFGGVEALDPDHPERFVEAFFRRLQMDPASMSPGRRRIVMANDFRALAASMGERPSMKEDLPAMRMPVLLYAGGADPVHPRAREAAEELPDARFLELPGLDHAQAFERSDLVLPAVEAFLAGKEPGEGAARP